MNTYIFPSYCRFSVIPLQIPLTNNGYSDADRRKNGKKFDINHNIIVDHNDDNKHVGNSLR